MTHKIPELDDFDRAILVQVQADNLTPARVLADRVGLSASAVQRRLKRLRSDGVITADRATVDPAALGLTLTLHVLVSLERETSDVLDAFARHLRSRPEVAAAWYVTGEADYVLLLRLESMEAYERFTREVFHSDPNIRAFRTMVAIRPTIPIH